MADNPSAPYRVLARKYRPRHFGELIGQGSMVRTLTNAFAHGRIAQAWMLTGVRGVGKTTTARILARALNYEREGEPAVPTIDVAEPGVHCAAILEGRHVDVIEMDAASHTSINDIREITDAARYKPVSAAYKIYVIDEVHMLSTAAFNGLLKTLEEPPAHVKFIFATTEIRKVPVTVLSRCQRFDLRRVDGEVLTRHLADVAAREGIAASEPALRLVARAAEGSVRDALSLLDQAINHGAGQVDTDVVRDMLGLADHTRILDLFDAVMKGNAAAALTELAAQYDVGADPFVVLSDLAALTHQVTRLKVTGAAPDPGEPQDVSERSQAYADALGVSVLSQMWQALLTGLQEVQGAPRPVAAAEMVLVRLCYLASLIDPEPLSLDTDGAPQPAPGAAHRSASGAGADGPAARLSAVPVDAPQRAAGARPAPAPRSVPRPVAHPAQRPDAMPQPGSFAELAAALTDNVRLKYAVERTMRCVHFEEGRIEVALTADAEPTIAGELGRALSERFGRRWMVSVVERADTPTLAEAAAAEQERLKREAMADPLVQAILDRFKDASIERVVVHRADAAGDDTDSGGTDG